MTREVIDVTKNFVTMSTEVFHMKKIFIIAAIFAVILSTATVEAHMGDYYWGRVVNCNEWISLREHPSTSAVRLAKIPLGATVKIYKGLLGERSNSPTDGFYWTEYNGMHGWCLMEYISVGSHAGSLS